MRARGCADLEAADLGRQDHLVRLAGAVLVHNVVAGKHAYYIHGEGRGGGREERECL